MTQTLEERGYGKPFTLERVASTHYIILDAYLDEYSAPLWKHTLVWIAFGILGAMLERFL